MAITRPRIFLDLDGVCCDFVGAATKTLGRTELLDDWPKNKELDELLSLDRHTEFLPKLEALGGFHWWAQVPEYPWFKEFYDGLKGVGDVTFLTTPSHQPSCVYGKLVWLHDRLGDDFSDYIFTRKKELLAQPGTLLIDDTPEVVKAFIRHGGHGIVFPQPWNGSDLDIYDPLKAAQTLKMARRYFG